MFKKPIPLKFDEHRHLKVLETNDYSFARSEIMAPIVFDEMAEIAREYPLVFPDNQSDLPCALLGLEADQNAYVAEDGRWLATYVPAYIRRYPFMLGQAQTGKDEDKNRFILMFEAEAPHFKDPHGHPIFKADGQLTPHMERRVELVQEIQKKVGATQRMIRALASSGLLVERVIKIKKPGEIEHRVQGLRVVDEKKLNGLPDAEFNALRRAGLLPLIYAHLLSWANFRQGPLAGKYPALAEKTEAMKPGFLFESDLGDLIDFS